jgi:acetyltransferase-like isoleucine patch superfamily enzyme
MTWRHELGKRRRAVTAGLIQAAWRRMQQGGTVTAESAAGRRFAAFGPGSLMAFPTGSVYGEGWIELGDQCMIAELVTLCAGMAPGQDLGPDALVRIGDRCVIGRGSHIVAHHSIEIGADVFTGPYVYITDQNHSYADLEVPVGRQWPVNSRVRIGAGTWLGTGAVVLPGADIGRNVVVAAGAVVRGHVPDYAVVGGVPAKVIREYLPGSGWVAPASVSEPISVVEPAAMAEPVLLPESVPGPEPAPVPEAVLVLESVPVPDPVPLPGTAPLPAPLGTGLL